MIKQALIALGLLGAVVAVSPAEAHRERARASVVISYGSPGYYSGYDNYYRPVYHRPRYRSYHNYYVPRRRYRPTYYHYDPYYRPHKRYWKKRHSRYRGW